MTELFFLAALAFGWGALRATDVIGFTAAVTACLLCVAAGGILGR